MIKKRGFTLVELLVVIAIIALLLSMLMPALNRAKKQARTMVCQSNIKQWGLFFTLYTNDYNGSFQGEWDSGYGYQKQSWLVVLFDYYKNNPKILLCPDGSKIPTTSVNKTNEAWGIWVGHFPASVVPKPFYDFITSKQRYGSYGINWYVANVPSNVNTDYYNAKQNDFWRRVDAKGGNRTPIFLDSMQWILRPSKDDRAPNPEGFTARGGWERACIDRHNGNVDAVFLDCSVGKIGLKELWKMKWHRNYTPVKYPWPNWMKKFKDYN